MLGSGTQRMVKDCRAYGLADLIWKEDGDHLVLEFPGLGIGEGVRDGVNDVVIPSASEGVNDILKKLVTIMHATPGMNAK